MQRKFDTHNVYTENTISREKKHFQKFFNPESNATQ